MKTIAVVPARGGSQGIKRKNLQMLGSSCLLEWTITAALDSGIYDEVVVSTDCLDIAEIARSSGALVPFIRDASLAHSRALAVPTIKDAVVRTEYELGCAFDVVHMLQPTSPFRDISDFKAINDFFTKPDSSICSVISVVGVGNTHPMKMKLVNDAGLMEDYCPSPQENMPRQDLPPVFIVNGCFYAVKRDTLVNKNTFKGGLVQPYVMPYTRSMNIDTLSDLFQARQWVQLFDLQPGQIPEEFRWP